MVQQEAKFCPNLDAWIRVYCIEKKNRVATGNNLKTTAFCVTLEGTTNIYCNNEAVYNNTSILESVPPCKHHLVEYHACRL